MNADSPSPAHDPAFVATLTHCAGTWLAQPPTTEEERQIAAAFQLVREQRHATVTFHSDPSAANAFSIILFRDAAFAPLQISDALVAQILRTVGEPPVVQSEADDDAFADYMRAAVLTIATARVRSALAAQLRRLLPRYVNNRQWREAIAIDYNAFRTALSNEATPFLVQMTLAGLARWYDERPADLPE